MIGPVATKSLMKLITGFWFLVPLVLSSSSGFVQVTMATLYGVVTDPTGTAVPGAAVTLTHQETNASSVRTTDSTGEFRLIFYASARTPFALRHRALSGKN